jgi:hypothetical protein
MIQVEFKGYVNGVKQFDWGTVYDVAHNQVKKNDQGQWEKTGADYFSVVGPEGFHEGDLIEVKGRMKTKRYDKRDGTKGMSLEVRADDITVVSKGSAPESKQGHAAVNAVWPTMDVPGGSDAPF